MELPELIFDPDRMTLEDHGNEVVRVFEWSIPPDGIQVMEDGDARHLTVSPGHFIALIFIGFACVRILALAIQMVDSRSWAHWPYLLVLVLLSALCGRKNEKLAAAGGGPAD